MTELLISNKNISSYGFRYLGREIEALDGEREGAFNNPRNLFPFPGNLTFNQAPLTLRLLHQGSNNKFEIDKSKFIKDIENATLKFSDLDFYYKVVYENSSTEKNKNEYYKELTLNLKIYEKTGAEITQSIKTSGTITLDSTAITPVELNIIPSATLVDVTIKGLGQDIKVKNLTANKTVTVKDGLVLEDNKNKFEDYDSFDFPYLNPGTNNITVDKTTITLQIKYKPRWI